MRLVFLGRVKEQILKHESNMIFARKGSGRGTKHSYLSPIPSPNFNVTCREYFFTQKNTFPNQLSEYCFTKAFIAEQGKTKIAGK